MTRKHIAFPLIAITLTGLLASACAPAATPAPTVAPTPAPTVAPTEPPAPEPLTITDGLGREVTLAAPPERIVTLAPSNTEILYAIGAGAAHVGRDEFSDYPPAALEVESIGSLYPSVNAEAIVALQPDLVLAAGITNPDDVYALAEIGLTVFATRFDVTLEDIYADILDVGVLTGRAEQAEEVVADMVARIASVSDATAAIEERPVVFYELDATEPSKPWTAGPGSFLDILLGLAGGTNAAAGATEQYFQMSLEELVAQDPDIIVLGSATHGNQTPALVTERAGWQEIAAVRNDAVYEFHDDLVSRPGPRIVEGLEELARLIHPDIFG